MEPAESSRTASAATGPDPERAGPPVAPARFEAGEAEALAAERYGLPARARELVSYSDQNFRLVSPDGSRHLLKIARPEEDPRALAFEIELLSRLDRAGLPVQHILPDIDGQDLPRVEDRDGHPRLVRLMTWLEGVPVAELERVPLGLNTDLGRTLARLDAALLDVTAPEVRTGSPWDLTRTAVVLEEHLSLHRDDARRARIDALRQRFVDDVLPRLSRQRRSVVHNDANDHNILVRPEEPEAVAGVIDFGDALVTPLVCEPAIAVTYAMLGADDPVAAAVALVRAFHDTLPLTGDEVDLVADLVSARLAVSVTLSTLEQTRRPDNAYIRVTEPHAWRLLEWFAGAGKSRLVAGLADACTNGGVG